MTQARIVLLVSTAPAVMELVTRVLLREVSTAVVLEARSGAEAIEIARVQPLGLVVLDLDLAGTMRARDICVKLRALRPSLPIVPIGTNLDTAPLLAELGCAPAVAKSLLVAHPSQLLNHIHAAIEQEPVLRAPEGAFSYLLEQADAALKEERRQGQIEVLVLCRNVLLRCGIVHSLESLGVSAHIVAAGNDLTPVAFAAPPAAQLVIGPLSDLVALQALARAARLPLLLIALHVRELELTPYPALAGASIILFDEGGDILHLLTALQRVVSGTPFLAVPAGVIAQWVTPLDRLTTREWEVIIGLALTADPAVVAQRSGLSIPSVETYAKRVRRKLGSGSLPETLALVQAHVTAQLGVAPTALYGFVDPAQRPR